MAKKSVKESDTKKNIKESNTKKTLKSKKKVEEKTEVDSPVVKKGKHGPYFGYGFRLGLFFVLFLLFFGAGVFALVSSIVIEDEKEIAYREVGNANYEVCYKKDDFYQGKCFSKDMNMKYIANLIDKIHLDFTYQFDIDEQENIDFTYDVIGKLIISDATSNKNYFEKEYSLIPSKKLKLENDKSARIEEDLDIDYGKYNSLANQFNKSYGVNSESKLLIYMNVHKQNQEDSSVVLNNYSLTYVTIPLSQKAIDIVFDSNQVNTTSNVVSKINVTFTSVSYAVVSALLFLLSIVFMIKSMRLFSKSFEVVSKYDKYVAKILREYDRLIGEAKNMVSFDEKEVIYLNKFSELLDIHDNLGLPIMYFDVTKHVKSYFYIVHDKMIYMYVAKAVDINK